MSMPRIQRTGVVLCAIALLIAGCSGGGGSSDNGSSSPLPRGLGGPGNSAHHHKHHGGKSNKPGKKHHHKGGPSSSSSPSNHPTMHSTPTQSRSTRPTQHTSSTPSGGGGGSHTPKPPSGPRVTVTPHDGLSDGQTVTVEGFGFKPNTALVVAECRDRGLNTNQSDCNVHVNLVTGSYGAAKRVTSDGTGHVAPVHLVVAKTFKSVNCGTERCLIAISEPTLRPDPSDEGDQYIHFQ
jgi:hypothetical protein